MLKSHLKFGFRSIIKDKAYSTINIIGLSIGICASLSIISIARYEFSFDRFHVDAERIFQVNTLEQYAPDDPLTQLPAVLPNLPDGIQEEISGVEVVAPFHIMIDSKVTVPESSNFVNAYPANAIVTDKRYFEIMEYNWVVGSKRDALSQPYQVVLSDRAAKKYFGTASPETVIGKTLTYSDSVTVTVTGVVEAWDERTEFPYEEFISLSTTKNQFLREMLQLDGSKGVPYSSRALIKLESSANFASMNANLSNWFVKKWPGTLLPGLKLRPIADVHFSDAGYNTGIRTSNLTTLYVFIGIASFILILAVINYINLATAQSIKREGEIGIRRVLGSTSSNLMLQFLTESFLITSFAVLIALPTIHPLLNFLQNFTSVDIPFNLFSKDTFILIIVVTLITTLLAGWYPARVVASFRDGLRLKAGVTSLAFGGAYLRKGLIVFQFTISLAFIIGSLVIGNQLRYMLHDSLGFSSDAIVMFEAGDQNLASVKLLVDRIKVLPGVVAAGRENMPPMGLDRAFFGIQYKAKSDQAFSVMAIKADENYLPLYGLRLIAGRNLTPSDTIREFIINESLSRELGFTKPELAVGEVLFSWNRMCPIVGVVEDFHQASFRETIKSSVIASAPCFDIAVKLDNSKRHLSDILNEIEKEWKNLYPNESIEYSFFDESIAQLYKKEQFTLKIANTSSAITIFISCIGLFGLAMFMTEKRTKEIGIRKVLGASTGSILVMLGKEILLLILIAIGIASTIASFTMEKWLQGFAYRISLNGWIFLSAGAIGIAVATLAVSILSVRAASRNPVESLRSE